MHRLGLAQANRPGMPRPIGGLSPRQQEALERRYDAPVEMLSWSQTRKYVDPEGTARCEEYWRKHRANKKAQKERAKADALEREKAREAAAFLAAQLEEEEAAFNAVTDPILKEYLEEVPESWEDIPQGEALVFNATSTKVTSTNPLHEPLREGPLGELDLWYTESLVQDEIEAFGNDYRRARYFSVEDKRTMLWNEILWEMSPRSDDPIERAAQQAIDDVLMGGEGGMLEYAAAIPLPETSDEDLQERGPPRLDHLLELAVATPLPDDEEDEAGWEAVRTPFRNRGVNICSVEAFELSNPYSVLGAIEVEPDEGGAPFVYIRQKVRKVKCGYRFVPRVYRVEPPPKVPAPRLSRDIKVRTHKPMKWPPVKESRYLRGSGDALRARVIKLCALLYKRGAMRALKRVLLACPSHGIFLHQHKDGYLGPNPFGPGQDGYFPVSSRPYVLEDPEGHLWCGDAVNGRPVTHRWGSRVVLEANTMPKPYCRAARSRSSTRKRGRSRSRSRSRRAGPDPAREQRGRPPIPAPRAKKDLEATPSVQVAITPPTPMPRTKFLKPPSERGGEVPTRNERSAPAPNDSGGSFGLTLKGYRPDGNRPANEGLSKPAQVFYWVMEYIVTPTPMWLPDPRKKSRNFGPLIDHPLGWVRDILGHVPVLGVGFELLGGGFCCCVRALEDAVNAATRPLGFTIFLLALLSCLSPTDALRRCPNGTDYFLTSACAPEDIYWMTPNSAFHKWGCVPCVNNTCWKLTGRGVSIRPGSDQQSTYSPWLDVLFSTYMACKLADWGEYCFPLLVSIDYLHRQGLFAQTSDCGCDCNVYLDVAVNRADLISFQFSEARDWLNLDTWWLLLRDFVLGAVRILTEVHPVVWVCLLYAALEKDVWVLIAMCTMVQVAEGGLMRLPAPLVEAPEGLLEGILAGKEAVTGYPTWVTVANQNSTIWWSSGCSNGSCPDCLSVTWNHRQQDIEIHCFSTRLLLSVKNYTTSAVVSLAGLPSSICAVYNTTTKTVPLSCLHDKRAWTCGSQVGWSPKHSHTDCGIGPRLTQRVWVQRGSKWYTTIDGFKVPINVSDCPHPVCEIPAELGWLPLAGLPVPVGWGYQVGAASNGLLTFLKDKSEQYFFTSSTLGRGPWLLHAYVLAIFGYSMGARYMVVAYLLVVTFINETTATVPLRTTVVAASGLVASTGDIQGYIVAFMLLLCANHRWAWVPAYLAKALCGLPVFATLVALIGLIAPTPSVGGLEVCLNIHIEEVTVHGWTTASFLFCAVIALRVWVETQHGRYLVRYYYREAASAHQFLYCAAWWLARLIDTPRNCVILWISAFVWPAPTIIVCGVYGGLLIAADLCWLATQRMFRPKAVDVPKWLVPIINLALLWSYTSDRAAQIAVALLSRRPIGLTQEEATIVEAAGRKRGLAAWARTMAPRRGRVQVIPRPTHESACWSTCSEVPVKQTTLETTEHAGQGFLRTLVATMTGKQDHEKVGAIVQFRTPMSTSCGFVCGGALYASHHGTAGRPLCTNTGPALPISVNAASDLVIYHRPFGAQSLAHCTCVEQPILYLFTREGKLLPLKPTSDRTGQLTSPVHLSTLQGSSGCPVLCQHGDAVGVFTHASHARGVASAIRWTPLDVANATISEATATVTHNVSQVPDHTAEGGIFNLHAPTGSGKSTKVPLHYVKKGLRTLVLVPNVAAVKALAAYVERTHSVTPSVYAAGEKRLSPSKLTYSTYGMFLAGLANNVTSFDVIILDECHASDPTSLLGMGLALTTYKQGCGRTYILATATPPGYRLEAHPDITEEELPGHGQFQFFGKFLDFEVYKTGRHAIFCPSKSSCDNLAGIFNNKGIPAVSFYRGKNVDVIPESGDIVVVATDALSTGYNGDFDTVTDSGVMVNVTATVDYDPTFTLELQHACCTADVKAQRRGRTGRGRPGKYFYASKGAAPVGSLDLATMIGAYDTGLVWFGMTPKKVSECIEAYRNQPGLRPVMGDTTTWEKVFTHIEGHKSSPITVALRDTDCPFPLLAGYQASVCHKHDARYPDRTPWWRNAGKEMNGIAKAPVIYGICINDKTANPRMEAPEAKPIQRILQEEGAMSVVLGVVGAGVLYAVLMQAAEKLSCLAIARSWSLNINSMVPTPIQHLPDPIPTELMSPCSVTESVGTQATIWANYCRDRLATMLATSPPPETFIEKATLWFQSEGLALWPLAALGAGLVVAGTNSVLAGIASVIAGAYTTTTAPVTVGITLGASLLASLYATPSQAMVLGGGFLAGTSLRTFGLGGLLVGGVSAYSSAMTAASLVFDLVTGQPFEGHMGSALAVLLSPGSALVGALCGWLMAKATSSDHGVWTNRLLAMLHKSHALPDKFFVDGKADAQALSEMLHRLRPWDIFETISKRLNGDVACSGPADALLEFAECVLRWARDKIVLLAEGFKVRAPLVSCQTPTNLLGSGTVSTICSCGSEVQAMLKDGKVITKKANLTCRYYWRGGLPYNSTSQTTGSVSPRTVSSPEVGTHAMGILDWVSLKKVSSDLYTIMGTTTLNISLREVTAATGKPAAAVGTEIVSKAMREAPTLVTAGPVEIAGAVYNLGEVTIHVTGRCSTVYETVAAATDDIRKKAEALQKLKVLKRGVGDPPTDTVCLQCNLEFPSRQDAANHAVLHQAAKPCSTTTTVAQSVAEVLHMEAFIKGMKEKENLTKGSDRVFDKPKPGEVPQPPPDIALLLAAPPPTTPLANSASALATLGLPTGFGRRPGGFSPGPLRPQLGQLTPDPKPPDPQPVEAKQETPPPPQRPKLEFAPSRPEPPARDPEPPAELAVDPIELPISGKLEMIPEDKELVPEETPVSVPTGLDWVGVPRGKVALHCKTKAKHPRVVLYFNWDYTYVDAPDAVHVLVGKGNFFNVWLDFSQTENAVACVQENNQTLLLKLLAGQRLTMQELHEESGAPKMSLMSTVSRVMLGSKGANIHDPGAQVNWKTLGIRQDPQSPKRVVVTRTADLGRDRTLFCGKQNYWVVASYSDEEFQRAMALVDPTKVSVYSIWPASLRNLMLDIHAGRQRTVEEVKAELRGLPLIECGDGPSVPEPPRLPDSETEWSQCSYSYNWFGVPIVRREASSGFSPTARITHGLGRNRSMLFYTKPDSAVDRAKKVTIDRTAKPGGPAYHKIVEEAKARAATVRGKRMDLDSALALVSNKSARSHVSGVTAIELKKDKRLAKTLTDAALKGIREGDAKYTSCTLSPKLELFVRKPETGYTQKAARFIVFPPLETRVVEKMLLGNIANQTAKAVMGSDYGFGLTPQEDTARKVEAWKKLVNPMIWGVDAIAFDSQITPEDMEVESQIYQAATRDESLKEDIKTLHDNLYKGSTLLNTAGEQIGYRACRASGVYTTSSSNCLTAWIKTKAALKDVGVAKYTLTVCGDDVTVILESSGNPNKDRDRAKMFANRLETLGLRNEGVEVAYSLSELETCSHSIIEVEQCKRRAYIRTRKPLLPLARALAETTRSNPMDRWVGNAVALWPAHHVSRVICVKLMDMLSRTGMEEVSFTYRGNEYTCPTFRLPAIIASLHGRGVFGTRNYPPQEVSATAQALQDLGSMPLSYWRRQAQHILHRCCMLGGEWRKLGYLMLGWSKDVYPEMQLGKESTYWRIDTDAYAGEVVHYRQRFEARNREIAKEVFKIAIAIGLLALTLTI
uniref:Polyprotein n=1 Tax=Jazzagalsvirus sp. TaxID=3163431 RepID=A0AAU7SRR9_9VIRU